MLEKLSSLSNQNLLIPVTSFKAQTMSEEREYKNLNLNRDCIEPLTREFCAQNGLELRSFGAKPGTPGLRICIGKVGVEDGTLDVYFINKDGTTTLQWNTGKNHDISHALAEKLFDTIAPDEFKSVNMTLKGFERAQILAVIELMTEGDDAEFTLETSENNGSLVCKLNCKAHGDHLVVTHHSTRRLQIQGRPLTCYRKLVYLMADMLDMAGLELVLSRRDESVAEIVRKEVAAEFLRKFLPNSYDNLPGITRNLLLAGQCVKISSPQLPEYSMLFFPELRSLEGALKGKLASFGFDSDLNDFGYFFSHTGGGIFELKSSFDGHITDEQTRNLLGKAYTFFNKHRHGLFHMHSVEDASRQIGSIEQLLSLSADAYAHLDNLYR